MNAQSPATVAPVVFVSYFPSITSTTASAADSVPWSECMPGIFGDLATYAIADLEPKASDPGAFIKPANLPLVAFAKFRDSVRTLANVEGVYVLGFDYDGPGATQEGAETAFPGVLGAIHKTFNHRPGAEALRVFLVASRPMAASEYARCWALGQRKLGAGQGGEAKDACRWFYLPARIEGRLAPTFTMLEGAPFDVDAWLAEADTLGIVAKPAEVRAGEPQDDDDDGCIREGDEGYEVAIARARDLCRKAPLSLREKSPARAANPDSYTGETRIMMLMGDLRHECELSFDDAYRIQAEEYQPRHDADDQWVDKAKVRRKYDEAHKKDRVALRSPRHPSKMLATLGKTAANGNATSPDAGIIGKIASRDKALAFDAEGARFQTNSDTEIVRTLADFYAEHSVIRTEGAWYAYDAAKGIFANADRRVEVDLMNLDKAHFKNDKGGHTRLTVGIWRLNGLRSALEKWCEQEKFFATSAAGLATKSGFVTVTATGEIEVVAHSADHRTRIYYDETFDRDAPTPTLDAFLADLWRDDADAADKRALAAEFFGVALFGQSTKLAKNLYLKGNGANGKSAFQEVMRRMFPDGSTCTIHPKVFGKPEHLAGLADKLLNSVFELGKARIVDTDTLKAVVVGNMTSVKKLYKDPVNIFPIAGHVFSVQDHLPATGDTSDGFFRRPLVLTFNRKFEGKDADPEIVHKVLVERAGILAWLVRGAAAAIGRKRFVAPSSSDTAVAEWRGDADMVRRFFDEQTTEVAGDSYGAWIGTKKLFTAYQLFAKDNGEREAISLKTFGAKAKELRRFHESTKDGVRYAVMMATIH